MKKEIKEHDFPYDSFYEAVKASDVEVVRQWIGKSPSVVNEFIGVFSPLDAAIEGKDIEMLELLLQAGADPNKKKNQTKTSALIVHKP